MGKKLEKIAKKPYYTVQDLAEKLHVSRWSVYKRIEDGSIPYEQYGQQIFIKASVYNKLSSSLVKERYLINLPRKNSKKKKKH